MLCPLCGCEFDETDHSCAGKCPMAAIQGCSLICCPNCAYQMVDENKSAAVQGGRVAGNAREELEKKSGRRVVSRQNFKELPESAKRRLGRGDGT